MSSHSPFKVGDIVVGREGNPYLRTCTGSVCKVVDTHDEGRRISVVVLTSPSPPNNYSTVFIVSSFWFYPQEITVVVDDNKINTKSFI